MVNPKRNVKTRKDNMAKEDESDREHVCTICFGKCSEVGKHMATRLATCGHIFGLCCIDQWVKKAHNCPICRSICFKRHFRGVHEHLGTRYDSSPINVAEEARRIRRNADIRRRRQARDRIHAARRFAAIERHGATLGANLPLTMLTILLFLYVEIGRATGSQHS